MKLEKVCIIGMGLIGGSLGLALKKNHPRILVHGVVHKKSDIQKVLSKGAADEVFLDPREGILDAQWIILATPPVSFEALLKGLAPLLKKNQMVTDVGSVKTPVMKAYQKILKNRVPYIGSHPIAGAENRGIECSRADLFEGAKCVITPDENTSSQTLKQITLFWEILRMIPIILSSADHDKIFAEISHLPHLVSFCLVNAISEPKKFLKMAGEAWRDMTRIAHSPSDLWTEISLLNRNNILKVLQKFSKKIRNLEEHLESSNGTSLKKFFDKAGKILSIK